MPKTKIFAIQTKSGLCIILLLCLAFLGANGVRAAVGDNQSRKIPIPAAEGGNHKHTSNGSSEFWHDGVNTSTPEVDINYRTNFQKAFPTNPAQMQCTMELRYKDGSEARVALNIIYGFNEGGLDIENKTVLNWSKQFGCGEMLETSNWINNNTFVGSSCIFSGFSIINGSAAGPTTNWTNSTMFLGQLNYGHVDYSANSSHNASPKISNVILSTKDYISNGTVLKESIADFYVTINGTISKFSNSSASVSLPVTMKFQVTHNITQTTYKYGFNANWSANRDFPTEFPMSTGSNYSLMNEDHLYLNYNIPGTHSEGLSTFDTNPANDTATWCVNGTVLSRQYLTTQYSIYGNSSLLPTKCYRKDIVNGNVTFTYVNVWFTGFRYNMSSGFYFDPEVVLYSSIRHTNPVVPDIPIIIIPAITIIAMFLIVSTTKKKRIF